MLILATAAALRLLLLPVPPSLSNDAYRYLWDGRVVLAGANPYALAPEADSLAHLRFGDWGYVWEQMSHRDVETVYPPLAIGLFSIAGALPRPLLALKLLLVGFELAGCALLLLVARRFERPAWSTLLYAWNPLVVLEVAGMGHVDGAALLPVAAGLLMLPRSALAAACLGAGVLVKLVPAVLVPLWARRSPEPRRFLGAALLVALAGLGPVVWAARGVPPGLVRYAVSWEFNGPLFEPLWRVIDRTVAVQAVKGALDLGKELTGSKDSWNRLYPWVYPQLLAKGALFGGLCWWVLFCLRSQNALEGTARTLAGALLCSATFYPWYALWVLPWAALLAWRSWLALSVSLGLSYLPRLLDAPGVELFPWVWLAVWLPPLLVWAAGAWWAPQASAVLNRE